MSPLQAITQNLPAFIREPAIKIIGQECYTTIIYNLDLDDIHCLRYSLSKVLGLGIVVGGSIVKIPQILKILSARSARGVSLSSYLFDTASLLIVVAYNIRQEFPFSTYGENFFLLLQNIVILLLIAAFNPSSTRSTSRTLTAPNPNSSAIPWGSVAGLFVLLSTSMVFLLSSTFCPPPLLLFLLQLAIPLGLISKIPQIVANARNRSTGQLSAFLVFNSFAGCAARVFTTATETQDQTLWWGFVGMAALNAVLAVQMAVYWNRSGAPVKEKVDRDELGTGRIGGPVPIQEKRGGLERGTTTPTLAAPKKWVRKAD